MPAALARPGRPVQPFEVEDQARAGARGETARAGHGLALEREAQLLLLLGHPEPGSPERGAGEQEPVDLELHGDRACPDHAGGQPAVEGQLAGASLDPQARCRRLGEFAAVSEAQGEGRPPRLRPHRRRQSRNQSQRALPSPLPGSG
ncbi:MAG: hypothetical protein RML12_09045 [Xanthomonadales bacterium]|nr:hypothetical protein [Xanthomonadales bacterium]